MPAWLALNAALDAAKFVPCRDLGRADAWHSSTPAVRDQAAEACLECPAFVACSTYAQLADEADGVWASVDRSSQRQRKAA